MDSCKPFIHLKKLHQICPIPPFLQGPEIKFFYSIKIILTTNHLYHPSVSVLNTLQQFLVFYVMGVFKVATVCSNTRFQSFLPLINRIVHHALSKFSPCLNKPLPQFVRVLDRYTTQYIHASASCPRCGNQRGLSHDCWSATRQD